ncbi:MAG TPA: hypothetical protein VLC28_07495, partial [Flavitalea sp.]|nr:hypothetical protein [Flavitalea sp.]
LTHKVAVLPFTNLSGHAEDQFIVEGFCEQLSSDLALFREISMISYFSTAKYRLEHSDIRLVGKELNASMLVTGSIYHDKKHLRVSVQLVSTETGIQLWAKTYQRDVGSSYIYDVIDSVIKQIISKLTGYTGVIIKSIATATQFEALKHRDFLDPISYYYYYQLRYTEDIFQLTRQQLEKTTRKNPELALPWAMLAQLYVDGCAFGYLSVQNPLHEGMRCAQRSLQLDPECQQGYMSLAWACIHLHDKQAALAAINNGLSLNPSVSNFAGAASFMLALLGEYEESIRYYEQSKQLEGGSPWWVNVGPILIHFYHGDYCSALQVANQVNIPGVFWNRFFKIAALGHLASSTNEAAELANQFQAEFAGQAEIGCVVLKKLLADQEIYNRIEAGLVKAGISIHNIHVIGQKAS